MARLTKSRSLEPVIDAAQEWIRTCLIADNSVLSDEALWTPENVAEVRQAFVEHPQEGKDNFFTKLKGQMESASGSASEKICPCLATKCYQESAPAGPVLITIVGAN